MDFIIQLVPLILVVAVIVGMLWYAGRNGVNGPGAATIVRCQNGHLFTTIWVPFISLKAIRLGLVRIQRCPVGGHLAFVTPVRESDLTDAELQQARSTRDTNIP